MTNPPDNLLAKKLPVWLHTGSHPRTNIFKPQKEKNRPCGFTLYEKRNFYILQRLGKCP